MARGELPQVCQNINSVNQLLRHQTTEKLRTELAKDASALQLDQMVGVEREGAMVDISTAVYLKSSYDECSRNFTVGLDNRIELRSFTKRVNDGRSIR